MLRAVKMAVVQLLCFQCGCTPVAMQLHPNAQRMELSSQKCSGQQIVSVIKMAVV